jgi:hypothetical protein
MKINPARAMEAARVRYERAMRRGCVAMADDALSEIEELAFSEIEELRAASPAVPSESAEIVVFPKRARTPIKRGIVFIRRGRRLERIA